VRDANGTPQTESPAEEPARTGEQGEPVGKSDVEQSGGDSTVAAPGRAGARRPHGLSEDADPTRPESGESTEAAVQQSTGPVTDEETGKETEPDAWPEPDGGTPLGAELEALRADLDERTRDLQRVTAEYANYRKRVDRDRGLMAEQATGSVLSALLPVLDDLDRARDHGDLVGPFGAVAEQLTAALAKFGLTPFGEKGDPFDPTRHEAVAHLTSPEVTKPTCIDVMRRGYLLGDRMLRPALVAVADPESE
jgi:molecular chaperone GrpE